MNLFTGIRLYNGLPVIGNLVYDKNGAGYIIPIEDLELDGHHLIINSDIPIFVDQASIGPVNKADVSLKQITLVFETDEQSAKEYAELKIDIRAEYYSREYDLVENAFLAGCQHVRTETHSDVMQALADVRAEEMQKGTMFAEWMSVTGFKYFRMGNRWAMGIFGDDYTFAELYASPEFLTYYEERRMKP